MNLRLPWFSFRSRRKHIVAACFIPSSSTLWLVYHRIEQRDVGAGYA
jgi:hypothetical protein